MTKKKLGVIVAAAVAVGAVLMELLEVVQGFLGESAAADSTVATIARMIGLG